MRTSDHEDTLLMGSPGSALKLEQYKDTHKVGYTVFGDRDYTFNYSVPADGKRVHLAFVANGTDIKLYVNGALRDTIQAKGPLPRSATQAATADSKDVKLYGSALSAADVKKAYDAASAPAPASLLNCWSFNEPSGGQIQDSTGNNAATSTGTRVPGRSQNGLKLTGNQEVIIGGSELPAPWSAAMWVKRDGDSADSVLLESVDPRAEGRAALKLEQHGSPAQRLGYTRFGKADDKFSYSVPKGEWHHLVFVADGTDLKLYVDGKTTPVSTLPVTGNLPRHRMAPVNTTLDEVKLFKGALSPQEILTAYQQPCVSPPPPQPAVPKMVIEFLPGPVVPNKSEVSFPNQSEVGKFTGAWFVIKNVGTGPLDIRSNPASVNLSQGSKDFNLTPPTVSRLAPGESAQFLIEFVPSTLGEQRRTVTVYSNDPTNPTYSFVIKGSAKGSVQPPPPPAGAPRLVVEQDRGPVVPQGSEVSFPSEPAVGTFVVKPFLIRNVGTAPLSIRLNPYSANLGPGGNDIRMTPTNVATMGPGGAFGFTVSFFPSTPGEQRRTVTVYSNDSINPTYSFVIRGNAKGGTQGPEGGTGGVANSRRAIIFSPASVPANQVPDSAWRPLPVYQSGTSPDPVALNLRRSGAQEAFIRIYSKGSNGLFSGFSFNIEGPNAECFWLNQQFFIASAVPDPYMQTNLKVRPDRCPPERGPYRVRLVIIPHGTQQEEWIHVLWN